MAEPIHIGLVQFNGTLKRYIPYSVALLQAFVQHHAADPERYCFMVPLYVNIPLDTALKTLAPADVVAFSTYMWNIRRSLAIAQILKLNCPNVLIVFGGPQVPDHANVFLHTHPYVDICCHGEGEDVFLAILEHYEDRDWSGIPGISYLNEAGQFCHHPPAPRRKDVNEIPSPYLSGTLEPLFQANPTETWIGTWETNRGCPFSCSFCDWGSAIQSKILTFHQERVLAEIDWFASHRVGTIFCSDGNFGILNRDLEIAEYVAKVNKKHGYPNNFVIQGTKNMTERAYQVHKTLVKAGLHNDVTLSLQSIHWPTLQAIQRENISLKTFQELQQRFNHDGIQSYTDLIVGLPEETYDTFVDGINTLIEQGQHARIKIFNALVLPNAEMGDPAYQQRYGLEIVENDYTPPEEQFDGISEVQQTVIATTAMPRPEWVRSRAFGWWMGFLHFSRKPLQMVFVILHQTTGLSYRDMLEAFSECRDPQTYPVICEIRQFFLDKAAVMQQGGRTEHLRVPIPALAQVDYTPEIMIAIQLCLENKIAAFFDESERLLQSLLNKKRLVLPGQLLSETMTLNRWLFQFGYLEQYQHEGIPFADDTIELELSYNICEVYAAVLRGQSLPLKAQSALYYKTWKGPPFHLVKYQSLLTARRF